MAYSDIRRETGGSAQPDVEVSRKHGVENQSVYHPLISSPEGRTLRPIPLSSSAPAGLLLATTNVEDFTFSPHVPCELSVEDSHGSNISPCTSATSLASIHKLTRRPRTRYKSAPKRRNDSANFSDMPFSEVPFGSDSAYDSPRVPEPPNPYFQLHNFGDPTSSASEMTGPSASKAPVMQAKHTTKGKGCIWNEAKKWLRRKHNDSQVARYAPEQCGRCAQEVSMMGNKKTSAKSKKKMKKTKLWGAHTTV